MDITAYFLSLLSDWLGLGSYWPVFWWPAAIGQWAARDRYTYWAGSYTKRQRIRLGSLSRHCRQGSARSGTGAYSYLSGRRFVFVRPSYCICPALLFCIWCVMLGLRRGGLVKIFNPAVGRLLSFITTIITTLT